MMKTKFSKQAACVALALICTTQLFVSVECGRKLKQSIDNPLYAVDPLTGAPAPQSVPFTSWPASRRASFFDLIAADLDTYVEGLPSILEQQFTDTFFDDEDGLLFGDDGLFASDFLGFNLADIFGNSIGVFSGFGTQLIDALNFFGVE